MPTHTELPAQFGRYRIVRKLGEGGMGAVYLADDTQLQRRVALKVPLLHSPEDLRRFEREARVAAAIEHPSVCPVLDVGAIDGIPFLIMPFVDGIPLTQVINPRQLLPPAQAVDLIRKMALALQGLHERGLMHRDLKPSNVMIKNGREPILMDFGLARSFHDDGQRLTSTGRALGTPAYMSPEQINGDVEVMGLGTDIYSLGVILYELLTGKLPFTAPRLETLYAQIFMAPVPIPSGSRPEIDPALDLLCTRAMAKKPADRFASMTEFASALERFLASRGYEAPADLTKPGMDASLAGMPLRLACPRCGHEFPSPPGVWGQAVPCPKCQGPVKIPEDLRTLPQGPAPGAAEPPGSRPTPPSQKSITQVGNQPAPQPAPNLVRDRVLRALLLVLALLLFPLLAWVLSIGDQPPTVSKASNPPEPPPPAISKVSKPPEPPPAKEPAKKEPEPQWPLAEPGGQEITNSLGMRLALIPPGKFLMGSPDTEPDRSSDEDPQHEVEVTQPFYMGVHEVTQEQYEKVMGANPSYFKNVQGMDTKLFPVERVSWLDAVAFCRKLSAKEEHLYRLPTEAEWEYACRGRAPLNSPFHQAGRSLSSHQANFDGQRPTTVGSYPPNLFGLYDMHGNVWEWCHDWYDGSYYRNSPTSDPQGPRSGSLRVLRGGSWGINGLNCRAANRNGDGPGVRNVDIGFRVVLGVRTP